MKRNEGITLIALVVTIVVLMILAGVSITMLMGDSGIIDQAKEAKRQTEYSGEEDLIQMAIVSAKSKGNYGEMTREDLERELDVNIGDGKYKLEEDDSKYTIVVKDSKYKEEHYVYKDMPGIEQAKLKIEYSKESWTNQNVIATASTSLTGFTVQTSLNGKDWENKASREFEENGSMYARIINGEGQATAYITGGVKNIDKEKPQISPETTATSSTIKIKATDNESGIIGYEITEEQVEPGSYIEEENTKELEVTVGSKKQGTEYYIWVKDEAGNVNEVNKVETARVPNLNSEEGGNITFKRNVEGWTNDKVTVTAETTEKGYTLETSIDNKLWEQVKSRTYTNNGRMYARLVDGEGQWGGTAETDITNIDRGLPEASIELSGAGKVETATVKATVTHTDRESSVKTMKYELNTNSAELGTEEESYTGTFSSNGEQLTLSIPSEETTIYYLHVLTIDEANNPRETISKAIKVVANKHTHTGDAKNGGGCYTTEYYHYTYTVTNYCNHSTHSSRDLDNDGVADYFSCYRPGCGVVWYDNEYPLPTPKLLNSSTGSGEGTTVPSGATITSQEYKLNCQKTEGQLESYTITY